MFVPYVPVEFLFLCSLVVKKHLQLKQTPMQRHMQAQTSNYYAVMKLLPTFYSMEDLAADDSFFGRFQLIYLWFRQYIYMILVVVLVQIASNLRPISSWWSVEPSVRAPSKQRMFSASTNCETDGGSMKSNPTTS